MPFAELNDLDINLSGQLLGPSDISIPQDYYGGDHLYQFFGATIKDRLNPSGRVVSWSTAMYADGSRSLRVYLEGTFSEEEIAEIKDEIRLRIDLDMKKDEEFSPTDYIKNLRRNS